MMMGMLVRVIVMLLVLGDPAFAQIQADPAKSAQTPWTLDPRCAIMGAHQPMNQGVLTPACLAAEASRPYLNPAPGAQPSQSQTQHSQTEPRPRQPRGED